MRSHFRYIDEISADALLERLQKRVNDELEADEVDSDTALTSSEALVGGALVAIIVAPIAAVLVIVAVIVAVVCCCYKKKKEEKASATGSADVASVEIKTSV